MIHLYLNPETSETSGEFSSLWEACQRAEHAPGAELIRAGYVLATADGEVWNLTSEGRRFLIQEVADDRADDRRN